MKNLKLEEIIQAIKNYTFEYSHENNIFIKGDIWLDCDFEINENTNTDPLECIVYDCIFNLVNEEGNIEISKEWEEKIEEQLLIRYK